MYQISIHAPTRGATIDVLQTYWFDIISIHAPTRGATLYTYPYNFNEVNFNPRSHERSDAKNGGRFHTINISIHAPTRGATSYNFNIRWYIQNFNPRSHERSDVVRLTVVQLIIFQSTLPREERQALRRTIAPPSPFQSTLPREERHQGIS